MNEQQECDAKSGKGRHHSDFLVMRADLFRREYAGEEEEMAQRLIRFLDSGHQAHLLSPAETKIGN